LGACLDRAWPATSDFAYCIFRRDARFNKQKRSDKPCPPKTAATVKDDTRASVQR
jgi:hypothetical protein